MPVSEFTASCLNAIFMFMQQRSRALLQSTISDFFLRFSRLKKVTTITTIKSMSKYSVFALNKQGAVNLQKTTHDICPTIKCADWK